MPPTLSKVSAIVILSGFFLVPLKNMCSRKCEMPLVSFVSYFEPVPTNAKTVTACVLFCGTVIILKTFLSVVFLNIIVQFCANGCNQFTDFNSFLLHGIPVADGDGVVFEGIEINGQAKNRADFILPAIPASNGARLVVLD